MPFEPRLAFPGCSEQLLSSVYQILGKRGDTDGKEENKGKRREKRARKWDPGGKVQTKTVSIQISLSNWTQVLGLGTAKSFPYLLSSHSATEIATGRGNSPLPRLWYHHSKLLTCLPDSPLEGKGIIYAEIHAIFLSSNFFQKIIRH